MPLFITPGIIRRRFSKPDVIGSAIVVDVVDLVRAEKVLLTKRDRHPTPLTSILQFEDILDGARICR